MYHSTPTRLPLRVLTVVFWGLRSDIRAVLGRALLCRQRRRVVVADDRRIIVGDAKLWCHAGLVA